MDGRSAQKDMRVLTSFRPLFPSIVLKAKPAINRGVDEIPEDVPSATTEVADQKVLGKTPEAVKPCLEEYEQEQKSVIEC